MIQYDINNLRSDIKDIKKKSQSIETQIPGQKKQLDSRLQDIEETQKATGRTVSDLLIQIQSLTSEFQVLTGRFEEARYVSEKSASELLEGREMLLEKLKEVKLEVADLKEKITQTENEIEAIRVTRKAEEIKKTKKEKKKKTVVSGKKEEPQNTEIRDIYLAGYQALKKGEVADAREKFTSLLEDYSENEYSDNARFWIGETYYNEGNFEEAILAYEELFKEHPKSDKIPGAMLKQGLAFYSLKDQKTGKIILGKLIEKYPDSEQAKLAKKKMKKTVVPDKKK
jgi:tol-pal system protein YbgF